MWKGSDVSSDVGLKRKKVGPLITMRHISSRGKWELWLHNFVELKHL